MQRNRLAMGGLITMALIILVAIFAPLIVQYTLGVVTVILVAASLSFIGVGVPHPMPEWGLMISAGRTYLRDHWYI